MVEGGCQRRGDTRRDERGWDRGTTDGPEGAGAGRTAWRLGIMGAVDEARFRRRVRADGTVPVCERPLGRAMPSLARSLR